MLSDTSSNSSITNATPEPAAPAMPAGKGTNAEALHFNIDARSEPRKRSINIQRDARGVMTGILEQ